MELLTPKVQINTSIRTNASGEIMERSTLLNIRTDEVQEAINLFSQLRSKMDDQPGLAPVQEKRAITANDLFPDEQQEENACPECGNKLVQRSGRNGFFLGCKSYPNCRYTRQA